MCAHYGLFLSFYRYSAFTKLCNTLCIAHRVVVTNNDQILVFTASYCALVQRVDNTHVCFLFEAQQATLMELHTVAAIRTDADHCPYNQCDLWGDSMHKIYRSHTKKKQHTDKYTNVLGTHN